MPAKRINATGRDLNWGCALHAMEVVLGFAGSKRDARPQMRTTFCNFVLASSSPRRRKLLKRIVPKFKVKVAEINERIHAGEPFSHAAVRLAELKAKKIAKTEKNAIVIGADTAAYLGKKNFRKTASESKARKALRFLSGKTHFVVTGVANVFPDGKCIKYCEKASVRMRKLDERMLENYLKSGEWRGRAGCYDVSGKGRRLIAEVRGDRETVVGLPLRRLRKLLAPYL
jgi:septum formation protein